METITRSNPVGRIFNRPFWYSLFTSLDINSIAIVLFLRAGAIKESEGMTWLPVDLTVVSAALCAILLFVRLGLSRWQVPKSILWMYGLFGLFLFGLLNQPYTTYAVEKSQRLFTLTLLSATAAAVLFRNREQVRKLIIAMSVVSLSILVTGLQSLGSDIASRMVGGSADTVATGQLAGTAFLGVLIWGLEGSAGRFGVSLVFLAISLISLLAAGSKGPIVACGVVTLSLFVIYKAKLAGVIRRLLLILLVLAVAVTVLWQMLPTGSTGRIANFFTDGFNEASSSTAMGRTEFYSVASSSIPDYPFGAGWGGFGSLIEDSSRQYPHNIILEIFLEAGWIAGLAFVLLLSQSLYRLGLIAWRANTWVMRAAFALLVYYSICAMFSGDVNDNRTLFVLMFIALSLRSEE